MPEYDESEGTWVTINGNHIFIREGQSVGSAIKERFGTGGGGRGGKGGKGGGKIALEDDKKKLVESRVFNKEEYEKMDMQARREAWEKMDVDERDEITNARESVPAREKDLLKPLGKWQNTGDMEADIDNRLEKAALHMSDDSLAIIKGDIGGYQGVLRDAGIDEEKIGFLMCAATDALIAQELEAQNRQLGDHGAHHVSGNIDRAFDIFSITPMLETPQQQAELITAMIFHDMGYMTEPSRTFLDEGHPRWAEQYFNEELYSEVSHVLGKESAINIAHLISTHDGTELDWDHDPVGSALRLADNTALFEYDKLPPMFREVPENLDLLELVNKGMVDVDVARAQMLINITHSTSITPAEKLRFNNAANEMTAFTTKTTLGMLGADIDEIKWMDGHPVFILVQNDESKRYQETLDLGQDKFMKFKKAYGDTSPDLTFTLRNPKTGKVVLEGKYLTTDQYNSEYLGVG